MLKWNKRERNLRLLGRDWGELAYICFKMCGLSVTIEFPSDWHEHRRAWVRFGMILFSAAFSFPWHKVVPDEHRCGGPRYGFKFHSEFLWIHLGLKGSRDRTITFNMPWGWRNHKHKVLSEKETHDYKYTLQSGEVQHRKATIQKESRQWTRPWIPWRLYRESIDIQFDDEVGEQSGSWKGGVLGCSYGVLPGEAPVDTLRRMERERVFN